MSPKTNFARMRRILRDFYSASRDNFAFTFAMATLTIIGAGCTAVHYNQADSGHAAMQRDANSAPPKRLPKSATTTNSQLQTKAFQSLQPAAENTGNSAIHSSSGESSVAINGWQYCLAPSHAEHKVYISLPFPKNADLSNTQTAFGQMLLQSKAQHDDVQCPFGNDEDSISSMRKHAISFNRKFGNMIVTISWEPSQIYKPDDEDPVDANIYTGNSGTSAEASAWQYCLAPSYAENKVYISSPFPKSASLDSTETAFAKMLSHTGIQHDATQCPNDKDEPSVSSLREHAISFNHELGRTIFTLNWDPKTDPAASVALKAEDSSR
jgi:hypothetical protein